MICYRSIEKLHYSKCRHLIVFSSETECISINNYINHPLKCRHLAIIVLKASTMYAVEPLYNGQVGAEDFVRYSEVSFIERLSHNHVNLIP